MIVCQCRRVTDREVRAVVERGASSLSEIARGCGAGADCSGCRTNLEELLAEGRAFAPPDRADPRRLAVVAAA